MIMYMLWQIDNNKGFSSFILKLLYCLVNSYVCLVVK